MNKETLLEKAKKIAPGTRTKNPKLLPTDENIELALAWLKSEIGLSQINRVLDSPSSNGNILYSIAAWLKEAYRQGKIDIK